MVSPVDVKRGKSEYVDGPKYVAPCVSSKCVSVWLFIVETLSFPPGI